jgi:superfamily II DNA or RNA helicase
VTDLLPLREYQRDAIAALESDWADGLIRLGVVMATGSGKTVIFAHLIAKQHEQSDHKRSLVLVHRDELVNQAVDKLTQIAPHLQVGVVKAERDEVDAEVIVASVQTLAREHRLRRIVDVGLVIVDEVHHVAADTYRRVVTALGCFNGTRMAGFTATLARTDTRKLGDIIQKVSYSRDIYDLILDGFLVPVKGRKIEVGGLDLSSVRMSRGDFVESDLGEALEDAGAGQVIARAYREHAIDRAGILFAPTVSSAHQMTSDLNEAGIVAETVWGAMPIEDRRLTLKRFTAGEIQVLCNAMVLTEGYDAPHVSCAVIARPTASAPLYVQQVGRILRPHPGKADALVLDVVGASTRHRLANLVDLSRYTRDRREHLEPKDGESILELVDRVDERDERKGASGTMTATEIDLFTGSMSAWLQTHKGLWFIPTRSSIFFLYPDTDGTYRVVQRTRTGGYNRLHSGVDLSYGMAWAASYADAEDSEGSFSVGSRSASWRRRKAKPTDRQRERAKTIGLVVDPEWGKAELSDQISVHVASNALDKWVR